MASCGVGIRWLIAWRIGGGGFLGSFFSLVFSILPGVSLPWEGPLL